MSEGAFVCFGFFYKWQADSNQNSEDTPRSGAVWGSVKSIRGRCWEWGLQGARCCSQQAPGSSDSSVSTPSCAGRAPRCVPAEHPVRCTRASHWSGRCCRGERQAGRCSWGGTGKGEAAAGTCGWRRPPGRRHSIQNGHPAEETVAGARTPPRDSGHGRPMLERCWLGGSCSFFSPVTKAVIRSWCQLATN